MLESAYVFGDPSPYRAWLRNLARAANSSESVHDAGHALLEVRGLSYGFDARGTTSSEEMLLRSHDLPSVRGGSVSETNRTDYMALLRSPGAGLSLDDVVQRLRREPESKSATVQFPVTATAKPCLTTLDFKLRNGHIELTAFFRSQDVWRRQPANNAFLLDCVRLVAIQLGVQPGLVRVVVASAHVQEADLPGIQTFLHHAFVAVLDVPSDRPAVVAVVGRERPHGDLAGKPQAYFEAYSDGFRTGP